MPKYPQVTVKLTGTDGNAFAIIGNVQRALQRAGLRDEAKEYVQAAMLSGSYDDLLQLTMATVEVE